MKRSEIAKVSKRRQSVNAQRSRALVKAFGPRSTWLCAFSSFFPSEGSILTCEAMKCSGPVNGHELLKRSRAGSTDANLLDTSGIALMCSFHNGWIEDNPKIAHEYGLARHSWE